MDTNCFNKKSCYCFIIRLLRRDSGPISPSGERSSSKSKESSEVDSAEGRKGSEGTYLTLSTISERI